MDRGLAAISKHYFSSRLPLIQIYTALKASSHSGYYYVSHLKKLLSLIFFWKTFFPAFFFSNEKSAVLSLYPSAVLFSLPLLFIFSFSVSPRNLFVWTIFFIFRDTDKIPSNIRVKQKDTFSFFFFFTFPCPLPFSPLLLFQHVSKKKKKSDFLTRPNADKDPKRKIPWKHTK